MTATVYQTGGAKASSSTTITIAASLPPAPAVTARSWAHEMGDGCPGVKIESTFPTGGAFDWGTPIMLRLQRSIDGGQWAEFAVLGPYQGAPLHTAYDWLPPSGVIRYRVRAEAQYQGGSVVAGLWGDAPAVAHVVDGCWLYPYGQPEKAMQVRRSGDGDNVFDLRASVSQPLGSSVGYVSSQGAGYATGQVTLHTQTAAERDRLIELLRSNPLLLLDSCPEVPLLDRTDVQPRSRLWWRPIGQPRMSRLARGPWSDRLVEVDWVEQREPGA